MLEIHGLVTGDTGGRGESMSTRVSRGLGSQAAGGCRPGTKGRPV